MNRWLALVLIAAAWAGGWYVRGRRMDTEAQKAVAVAKVFEKQANEWKQTAEDADHAAAANGEKVVEHEKTIAVLRKQLDSHPRPGPLPPGAPVEVVVAHLGAVEVRLGDCEALVRAQDSLDAAFRSQVASLTLARDGYRESLKAETSRADALQVVATVPAWSVFVGTSIDQHTGARKPAFFIQKHLDRKWAVTTGAINGGAFLGASYSFGSK